MVKKIGALAVATAIALVPTAGANAATVPDGESFYGFAWSGEFFQIDPVTGASRSLFTDENAARASAADYNPVDGLIYALAPYEACELVKVDPIAQTSTTVTLTLDEGDAFNCRALAITAEGIIYASFDDTNLYVVDGETGNATQVGSFLAFPVAGLAYNDETDTLYAGVDEEGLYEVNVETGEATEVGLDGLALNGALDFASDGTLWLTQWDAVLSVIGLSETEEGVIDMGLSEGDNGTEAGFFAPSSIAGEEESQSGEDLASTGVDAAPLLGFAALAVLAGAVAVRSRRRV